MTSRVPVFNTRQATTSVHSGVSSRASSPEASLYSSLYEETDADVAAKGQEGGSDYDTFERDGYSLLFGESPTDSGPTLLPTNRTWSALDQAISEAYDQDDPLERESYFAILPSSFRFPHVPAQSERHQHAFMLRASEANAANLNSQISELKQKLAQLQKDHSRIVAKITLSKGFLSPLRKVPIEVIGHICSMCVFELEMSPWILASVSKQFREAVSCYKRLWSYIKIDAKYKGTQRYIGGYEICRTVPELERSLERSRAAPLTVIIENCKATMAIELASHKPRWESVDYNANQSPQVERALFEEMPQTRTPVSKIIIRNAFQKAEQYFLPKWIRNIGPKPLQFSKFSDHSLALYPNTGWSELSVLEITFKPHYATASDAKVVWSILNQARIRLTSLTLEQIPWCQSMDVNGSLHFPQVSTLSLLDVASWWRFDAPEATELHFRMNIERPSPHGITWLFPEVVSFRYHGGPGDATAVARVIQLPKLDMLAYLETGNTTGGFIWEQTTATGTKVPVMHPRVLHMHKIQARYADLREGVRTLDSVSELHFHSSELKSGFLKALMKTDGSRKQSKAQSATPSLLPQLQVLHVEIAGGSWLRIARVRREEFTKTFTAIAAKRRGTLKVFTVKWPRELEGGETTFLP